MQELLTDHIWNLEKLQQLFAESMKTQRWSRANAVFKALIARHPENLQLCSLYVALCLEQGLDEEAIRLVEKMVASGIPDNDLIKAALAIRKRMHPRELINKSAPEISLCMIVRNEIKNIGRCLYHCKSLVDEIILVDTGSTDRTKDVGCIYGANVYDYSWHGDFSAARNHSLEKASGRWILILDADEVIAEDDFAKMQGFIKEAEKRVAAFSMETRNYCHRTNNIGWHANDGFYKRYEAGLGWFPSIKVRLFKRDPLIRFHFPVHERVEPSLRKQGLEIAYCPIPVHHYGHLDERLNLEKARRYYEMGYAKLAQMEGDVQAIRELAVQAGQLQKWSEAISLWQRLIELKPDYPEGYINLASGYWQLGNYDRALHYSKKAIEIEPNHKEATFNAAISFMMLRQLDQASQYLQNLLSMHPEYLGARFMLAAVFNMQEEDKKSRHELNILLKSTEDRVLELAIDDLLQRCKRSQLYDFAIAVGKMKDWCDGSSTGKP